MSHIFTNKFQIGDDVVCVKSNKRYPEGYIQVGDTGKVLKIWQSSYWVEKTNHPEQKCLMQECYIDFSDITKREPIKTVRIRTINPKIERLKLLKKRHKIMEQESI